MNVGDEATRRAVPAVAWLRRGLDRLDAFLLSVVERERAPATMRVFTLALYVWLAAQTLAMLPYGDEIWGPDAFVLRTPFRPDVWYHWITHLANHPALDAWPVVFVGGQLAAVALGFWGRFPRLAAVLVYVFTINLCHRTAPTVDGGNNLSYLLLFYAMLGNVSGRSASAGRLSALSTGLANVVFWACRLQVVLVYACAGIFKLQGKLWQNGMALYYILQSDSFSHPRMHDLVIAMPWLAMAAAYATIAFQLSFPFLIWLPKARLPLVVVGTLFHVGIAAGMGLLFFGWVMVTSYLLFLPEEAAARVLARLRCDAPLRVEWPGGRDGLRRVAAALDLRRTLRFEPAPEAELRVTEPSSGACWTGPRALLRLLTHGPVGLALYPVLWTVWFFGAFNLVEVRRGPRPPAAVDG